MGWSAKDEDEGTEDRSGRLLVDWTLAVGDTQTLSQNQVSDFWVANGGARDSDTEWSTICQEIGANVGVGIRLTQLSDWLADRIRHCVDNRAWRDASRIRSMVRALEAIISTQHRGWRKISTEEELEDVHTQFDARGRNTYHKRLRITIPWSRQSVWLEYEQDKNDFTTGVLNPNAVAILTSAIKGRNILFKYARQGSQFEGVWHVSTITSTHATISRDEPTDNDRRLVDQGRGGSVYSTRHWAPAIISLKLPGLMFRLNGHGTPRPVIAWLVDGVANYAIRNMDRHRHHARSSKRAIARQAKRKLFGVKEAPTGELAKRRCGERDFGHGCDK